MAAATQIDTIQGAVAPTSGPIFKSTTGHTKKWTMSRRYRMYISNNSAAVSYQLGPGPPAGQIFYTDMKWHKIPYEYTQSSLDILEWEAQTFNANCVRCVGVGYEIEDFVPLFAEVQMTGGVNRVKTTLFPQGKLWHQVDHNNMRKSQESRLVAEGVAGWDDRWCSQNNQMSEEMMDIPDSTMPRLNWFWNAATLATIRASYRVADVPGVLAAWESEINDQDIDTHGAGARLTHWHEVNGKWIPIGAPIASDYDLDYTGNKVLHFPKDLQEYLQADWNSGVVNNTQYLPGSLGFNPAIGISEYGGSIPETHMLKVAPYQGIEGPINVIGEIWIVFKSTWEADCRQTQRFPFKLRQAEVGLVLDRRQNTYNNLVCFKPLRELHYWGEKVTAQFPAETPPLQRFRALGPGIVPPEQG